MFKFISTFLLTSLALHPTIATDTQCPDPLAYNSSVQDRRFDKTKLKLMQYNVEWLFLDYYGAADCPGDGCTWKNESEAVKHFGYVKNIIDTIDPDIINFCEIEGCDELEGDESKECFENGVTKHISENFKYPRKALKNQIEGDVFIQFTIDEFGFLIDFTTVGPDKVLEDEAYRIMSMLKVKNPAQLNGKNVKMTYGIPISFRLN